ncbi:CLUMA_CG013820, isoform A [Clunio marinus]|uniref:CLUMA_CG013820, isoform A n=1 Tax=Clunio marinus TaxID=568069 RepID=A0A1J1IK50_9DIPT|nr:CLUMA_CG013820, isoform A [Clunio marinus]
MYNQRNCDNSSVIKLLNASFEVNKNCDLKIGSCSDIKAYKSAIVEFQALKGRMIIYNTKFNLCALNMRNIPQLVLFAVAYLGVPLQCPVASNSEFCYKNETLFTFSEATRKMLGYFVNRPKKGVMLKASIVHDTGKSCLSLETKMNDGKYP